jgi:hypothetical protein
MVLLKNVLNKTQHRQHNHITIYFDTNGSVTAISRITTQILGYTETELH